MNIWILKTCEVKTMVKKLKELESLTVDEIERHIITSPDGGIRMITPKEAETLHGMIHKTDLARQTFEMNDVELARAVKFAEKHKKCVSISAMSEKFEYTFVPGGIGTGVGIKCLICNEKENITDIDSW
jgi:hypothetical protein